VTLVIYEGWQGAMGLQELETIQSWRINGFSPGSCELNRQSILVATNSQFAYKAFKFVSFTDTYQMDFRYKNTCICIGEWDPGIWRYACWLTDDMLPEFSHANVSTLASEETDNMLFQVGDFHPRESEQLELYMITLIKWDLGPVEFYKSNYRCAADTRLIQWDLGPACQMVLAATKWWQEHFNPWKSNSDQHHSEKMSHSNINVFSSRDGVQQHFRIVKRLCCSTKQYDPGILPILIHARSDIIADLLLRDQLQFYMLAATNLLCWMHHLFQTAPDLWEEKWFRMANYYLVQ
jgi:hypothetical protein